MKSSFKIGFVAFVAILAMSFTVLSKANVLGSKVATAAVVTGCYSSVTYEGATPASTDDVTIDESNAPTTGGPSSCAKVDLINDEGIDVYNTPIKSAHTYQGDITRCTSTNVFCCYDVKNNVVTGICYRQS
jgi:hypothetical protein